MSKKDSITSINILVNNSGYIKDDKTVVVYRLRAHVGEWVLGQ